MYYPSPMKRLVTLKKHRRGKKKLPRATSKPELVEKKPAPPKPSVYRELLERGKLLADRALGKVLDTVEKDPEAAVRGAERAAESLGRIAVATGELRRWARENPEEARQQLRDAVLRGIAQAAKKKQGDG